MNTQNSNNSVEQDSSYDFWTGYVAPSNFLTKEQRVQIVKNRTPLYIVDVQEMSNGRYGPTWTYELQIKGYDDLMMISVQKNSIRDDFSRQVQNYLHENPNGKVPAILSTIKTAAGQTAYIFDNPVDMRGTNQLELSDLDNMSEFETADTYDKTPF